MPHLGAAPSVSVASVAMEERFLTVAPKLKHIS
jgi:hypothetical protein